MKLLKNVPAHEINKINNSVGKEIDKNKNKI